MSLMLKRVEVTAFVDWQAQIVNAGQKSETRASRKAEHTINFVANAVASVLEEIGQADLFKVGIRLYHGWYRALTATENRTALEEVLFGHSAPTRIKKAILDWTHPFGDTLLDAYSHRQHPRLRVHLPDTLREDLELNGRLREKMVDTALVCDVLFSARTSPETWRLVLAEDDDVVPAVFVAEKWGKEKGGKTLLLRSRGNCGHLALNGLVRHLEQRR